MVDAPLLAIGPLTIDGNATVVNGLGTTTNVTVPCKVPIGVIAIQCISTSSLAYKVYVSYDGGATFSPIRSVDSAGASAAADVAITASATKTTYFSVFGANAIKVARTAGSGSIAITGFHNTGIRDLTLAGLDAFGAVVVGHGKTLKTASGTLTADTDIVAAVASKRIKVYAYSIITTDNTADTIIFKAMAPQEPNFGASMRRVPMPIHRGEQTSASRRLDFSLQRSQVRS